MRRLLCSILILTILAFQSLCPVHAHGGIGLKHSGAHAGRPHFHVSGFHLHAKHDHSSRHCHHQTPITPDVFGEPVPCHDGDAFYLADSVSAAIHRSGTVDTVDTLDWLMSDLASGLNGLVLPPESSAPSVRLDSPSQWSTARVPLFLRSLAIRC